VVYGRTDSSHVNALYDTNWNSLEKNLRKTKHTVIGETITPKPDCLDIMLSIASKLAEPFPEVRVDFYVVKNRPVIGELTFSTGYGSYTDEYYNYLGEKMNL
jgi:hypothetical protein